MVILAEWSPCPCLNSQAFFTVSSLPCPAVEGSDGAALVAIWPPARVNPPLGVSIPNRFLCVRSNFCKETDTNLPRYYSSKNRDFFFRWVAPWEAFSIQPLWCGSSLSAFSALKSFWRYLYMWTSALPCNSELALMINTFIYLLLIIYLLMLAVNSVFSSDHEYSLESGIGLLCQSECKDLWAGSFKSSPASASGCLAMIHY